MSPLLYRKITEVKKGLKEMKNSIKSVDKKLFFPKILILRVKTFRRL